VCSAFCVTALACRDTILCNLADPAGAQAACVTYCKAGFATLTTQEANLLTPCFTCLAQAAQTQCFKTLPNAPCASICNDPAVSMASDKWSAGVTSVPTLPAGLCTDGQDPLTGTCGGSKINNTSCTVTCCNGPCTVTEVAFQCTAVSGPGTCTCTIGKHNGRTFSLPSGTDCQTLDAWSECNF
jgi:hypothetical protein